MLRFVVFVCFVLNIRRKYLVFKSRHRILHLPVHVSCASSSPTVLINHFIFTFTVCLQCSQQSISNESPCSTHKLSKKLLLSSDHHKNSVVVVVIIIIIIIIINIIINNNNNNNIIIIIVVVVFFSTPRF